MALTMGKLTILVGAGILGAVLAKEERLPSFSDVISSVVKVALKPTHQSNSTSSTSKPRNDALMAQVNSLRQELQLLASSKPVTIVTSNAAGGRRYGVIIVIAVVGYGYVRWKGWKIQDFMFATKRGLSDACKSVAKQLDDVFLSLRATRNDLSSKIDGSSHKYDEIVANSITTKEEVSVVRGTVSKFTVDLQTVNHKIRTLETRMGRIQEKQDDTKEGVARLLLCTLDAENKFADLIQDSPSSASSSAIEHQQIAAPSRTASLPLVLEPSSPSTSNGSSESGSMSGKTLTASGSRKVNELPRRATLASGEKECQGTSGAYDINSSPRVSNGIQITEITEKPSSPESHAAQSNVKTAGLLSRTISATRYFKFM
ncbi:uncharacterized protein LOC130820625 [Amaranthus tricolor]|uniref:uncharacterized protein LOC130820625 n=1 Tax=Amaranthus tricolor TaxID=29722 RepID=UPI0025893B39|nr:uncharacterized protein LOC130820625 [Amaranthus tricolor]XP_057542051.1 uncharacterized protein LOC130820625 [Amaranthus tricolor]